MALLIAYTLHDSKALNYNPPFFMSNDALARRACSDLVTDMNTSVARHPSDFKLYKIGMFDDTNAIFTPFTIPEHVIDIIALVPRPASRLFDPARDERGSANGYFQASADGQHPDQKERA